MTSRAVISRPAPLQAAGKFLKDHALVIAGIAVAWLLVNILAGWLFANPNQDVLDTAYSFPDGGGYCSIKDTGVSYTIKHDGLPILLASKNGSTYCCGYTFEVAMKVAEERGWLHGKSIWQIRQFQQEWYGATRESALKQCAIALEDLGIGREIPMKDAEAGDFMAFSRVKAPGHSVIFLNWVKDDHGQIIGLHYHSSQGSTDGIADSFDYFSDSGYGNADRSTLVVGRMSWPWWCRLLHPFGG